MLAKQTRERLLVHRRGADSAALLAASQQLGQLPTPEADALIWPLSGWESSGVSASSELGMPSSVECDQTSQDRQGAAKKRRFVGPLKEVAASVSKRGASQTQRYDDCPACSTKLHALK